MTKRETEFDFTLLLDGINSISQSVEDALFESGCDDATISLRFGRISLTFSRSAISLKNAIISAIDDVKKSGIPASILRVDQCDLVTRCHPDEPTLSRIFCRNFHSKQILYVRLEGD